MRYGLGYKVEGHQLTPSERYKCRVDGLTVTQPADSTCMHGSGPVLPFLELPTHQEMKLVDWQYDRIGAPLCLKTGKLN